MMVALKTPPNLTKSYLRTRLSPLRYNTMIAGVGVRNLQQYSHPGVKPSEEGNLLFICLFYKFVTYAIFDLF